MLSSAAGHVIYPVTFESCGFLNQGYLQMNVMQGQLLYDNMSFALIKNAFATETETMDYNDSNYLHENSGNEDSADFKTPYGNAKHPGRRLRGDSISYEAYIDAVQEMTEIGSDFVSTAPRPEDCTAITWSFGISGKSLLARARVAETDVRAWDLVESMNGIILTNACSHPESRRAGPLGQHFLLSDSLKRYLSPKRPKHVIHTGRGFQYQQLALGVQDADHVLIVHNAWLYQVRARKMRRASPQGFGIMIIWVCTASR